MLSVFTSLAVFRPSELVYKSTTQPLPKVRPMKFRDLNFFLVMSEPVEMLEVAQFPDMLGSFPTASELDSESMTFAIMANLVP